MGHLSEQVKVHGALLLVSMLYGFFYVAVKLLLVDISAEQLLLLRLVLSALIVMPIEWLYFKTRLPWPDVLKLFGISLLGIYIVQFALIEGAAKTASFYAALLMATVPIITLLLNLLLKKESFHWVRCLGIALGFSGVALVLSGRSQAVLNPAVMFEGNLWVVTAAISFALFLLASQPLLKRYRAFSVMAYSYLYSSLVALVFFWNTDAIQQLPAISFSSQTIALLAFIVLGASIATYTLNNYALRRTSSTVVALYMFLAPVQSAVWGTLILKEPFTLTMGLAAGLTFIGVLLANYQVNTPLGKQSEAESLADS